MSFSRTTNTSRRVGPLRLVLGDVMGPVLTTALFCLIACMDGLHVTFHTPALCRPFFDGIALYADSLLRHEGLLPAAHRAHAHVTSAAHPDQSDANHYDSGDVDQRYEVVERLRPGKRADIGGGTSGGGL
jgi:hypothetical protein